MPREGMNMEESGKPPPSRHGSTNRGIRAGLILLLVLLSATGNEAAAEIREIGPRPPTADGLLAAIEETDWDLSRAARVTGRSIEWDTGSLTLESGWVFVMPPVAGLWSRAMYFGEGGFRLTAPIPMERDQIRRFLGTGSVDVRIQSADLHLFSTAHQPFFRSLSFTADAVAEARAASPECDSWLRRQQREQRATPSPDEAARRAEVHLVLAEALHGLLQDPAKRPTIVAEVELAADPAIEPTSSIRADRLLWSVDPDRLEQTSLRARFDHGREQPWSLVSSFARSDQYEGRFRHAATSPALERGAQDVLVVKRHRIWVDLDPSESDDTHVHAMMDVEVLADRLAGFPLGISPALRALSVQVNGKELDFQQPRLPGPHGLHSESIRVLLPEALPKGEKFALAVELEGRLLETPDGERLRVRDLDRWYPVLQGETRPASFFDTTFRVPEDFQALSNGEAIRCEEYELRAESTCFRYRTLLPIFQAFFALNRHARVERGTALNEDETPIEVWTSDQALFSAGMVSAKHAFNTLARTQVALRVFEDWFGPYPYAKLAVASSEGNVGRGGASLVLLGSSPYYLRQEQDQGHLAHELAHQWWGNVVGIRSDRDQWFSEGFADYASTLYLDVLDRVNGTDWRRRMLARWHRSLTEDDGYLNEVVPLTLGNRFDSAENRRGYESRRQDFMYGKGGFVMHMLRSQARFMTGDKEAGDELFRTAIRKFIDEHHLEFPSNLDLQESLSRSFGTDLSWFFEQWVHGMGLPKLRFSHELVDHAAGGTLLRGRIVQRQEGEPFRFPVAVYLASGKGRDRKEAHLYQWIEDRDTSFEVGPLPWRPQDVSLNDDLGLLAIVEQAPWEGGGAATAE